MYCVPLRTEYSILRQVGSSASHFIDDQWSRRLLSKKTSIIMYSTVQSFFLLVRYERLRTEGIGR